MTERLATALRETADAAPAYDVLDAAIRVGRRRRVRARVGSGTAMLAVLMVVAVLAVPVFSQGGFGPATNAPFADTVAAATLPDRIWPADTIFDGVQESPPGAASVLFMESQYANTGGALVTVGAHDDTYRYIGAPQGDPGRTALLNPAGTEVAVGSGSSLLVSNLDTGITRHFAFNADVTPTAWMPDGSGLIVMTITVPTADNEDFTRTLSEVDARVGGTHDFAQATWPIAPAGFAVAVSPDAMRIAYQFSDFVTVYERVTGAKKVFTLPARSVLAGKGAWTADGRSLAIVQRDARTLNARRWQVLVVDPTTGVERDPTYRPAMDDISLIRLLGWNRTTNSPIVVGYQAATTAEGVEFAFGQNPVTPDQVHQVGVYELGASGVRTLIQPVGGVSGLDVADDVAATGRTRTAAPPNDDWGVAVAIASIAVLLAILMLGLLYRFRTRPRPVFDR